MSLTAKSDAAAMMSDALLLGIGIYFVLGVIGISLLLYVIRRERRQ